MGAGWRRQHGRAVRRSCWTCDHWSDRSGCLVGMVASLHLAQPVSAQTKAWLDAHRATAGTPDWLTPAAHDADGCPGWGSGPGPDPYLSAARGLQWHDPRPGGRAALVLTLELALARLGDLVEGV